MKALALAVAVATGLAVSAGTADAQYRSRGSYQYVAPTYVGSAYSYGTPSYYSPVVTSGYAPVVSSYTQGTVISSGYYNPTYVPAYNNYPMYSGNSYYSNSYYGNSSYSPGVNVTPAGVNWNGRGWRW